MTNDEAAKVIWDYMLMRQPLVKADLIFVLGNNDTRTAEHAARLYHDGWAPRILFSGNTGLKGNAREMWGMSEAEKFAEVAKDMGVPDDRMLLECESTNTGENIAFSRKLLEEKGIHPKNLIAVQKPYMERRVYATLKKQWPDMDFVMTSPPISFEEYPNEVILKEQMMRLLVGDVQRVRDYPAKGFQIEQDIPAEVLRACEQLIAAGFDTYIAK